MSNVQQMQLKAEYGEDLFWMDDCIYITRPSRHGETISRMKDHTNIAFYFLEKIPTGRSSWTEQRTWRALSIKLLPEGNEPKDLNAYCYQVFSKIAARFEQVFKKPMVMEDRGFKALRRALEHEWHRVSQPVVHPGWMYSPFTLYLPGGWELSKTKQSYAPYEKGATVQVRLKNKNGTLSSWMSLKARCGTVLRNFSDENDIAETVVAYVDKHFGHLGMDYEVEVTHLGPFDFKGEKIAESEDDYQRDMDRRGLDKEYRAWCQGSIRSIKEFYRDNGYALPATVVEHRIDQNISKTEKAQEDHERNRH